MSIDVNLKSLLNYLCDSVDLSKQEQIALRHRQALDFQPVDRLPLVMCYPLADDAPFKPYAHSETFSNPEKMLYNQLVFAFDTSIALHDYIDDDLPFTVRADFGTVLIASLFGAEIVQMDQNPPWVVHAPSLDEFKGYLQRDPLDFTQGWLPKVVNTLKIYNQILSDYPVLKKAIQIVLPDLQGPLDTADLLRGSSLFMELITEPDLIDRAMMLCAQAQIGFARHLKNLINDGPTGYSHQHAMKVKGNILIRNDSAVMISPDMYRSQIVPHDEYVLSQMGSGSIHSCGKIDHIVQEFMELDSCKSIDIGQPELNDLDKIYVLAQKHKVSLVRLSVPQEQLLDGSVMKRFPTGVTLVHRAENPQAAQYIMKKYKEKFN
ncbi:MAG: hypothetical protein JEZ07_18055 [Phycisphaerae bacterium]|nr:hypothetical protein [Phycisphaerae bacterium]